MFCISGSLACPRACTVKELLCTLYWASCSGIRYIRCRHFKLAMSNNSYIQDCCPDVWRGPGQTLPLDWDTDHFYEARQESVDGRLEEIAVMEKEEGFVALAPPKQVDNSFGRR